MGQKKKNNRAAGRMALENQEGLQQAQQAAQELYDQDIAALRDAADVTDFYADLDFSAIDPTQMQLAQTERAQMGTLGDASQMAAQGYTAQGTNVAGLARGADTGLSNVFNNLQVSTAGAEMAAREADDSLAASQDMMMMMGGGGGATALASQAAKSKAGIAADIDRQVKQNEMMRAQGEQALQRDLLAQGNLASQFDLGQQQFNAQAQNQAAQFTAQAKNQAAQFNAQAKNQFALSKFGAENQMNQFNANAANNAFAQQANAINNSIAQNAQMENQFNLAQAAGQAQAESNRYDALMGIAEISTNQLNEADRALGENQAVIDQARMSGMNKDGSYTKKWYEKAANAIGKKIGGSKLGRWGLGMAANAIVPGSGKYVKTAAKAMAGG
tara:strand:+ start:29 stop:1189 length:1161 start_codon:yes stop_codon:yes gene_type:complete